MELKVTRRGFTDDATEGDFFVGTTKYASLEPPVRPAGVKVDGHTAIPCGRYQVVMYNSPHNGRWVPLLLHVPGFAFVEIHVGNKPADTKACILVGKDQTTVTDAWIGQSKEALDEIVNAINAALKRGEPVWITVEGERNFAAAA